MRAKFDLTKKSNGDGTFDLTGYAKKVVGVGIAIDRARS